MQQSTMLKEIGELRTQLQHLRASGMPRTAEVHDKDLLQRFLNLRATVKFNQGRGGRRMTVTATTKAGLEDYSPASTLSAAARRKLRNKKKFTKYDGTSMEERRLMQEEKTRRKLAAIAELKRQREEAELVNCSFKFKARPVPSSSSNRQLEQTKVRLSALKGGDASVSLAATVRRMAAERQAEAADSKVEVMPSDLKGLFAKYCRVSALKRTSQSATMVKCFTSRRTMDIHQFSAFLKDFGLLQQPQITSVRATLIFQKYHNPKTKMIGYKEFSQALETVAAELGISFEQMAAKIMDRQATEHMHFADPESKMGSGAGTRGMS
eukprot:INCI16257.5.p1 GENE.INCI16257.5~~INCI16257.5.p1  ORF type:complete len:324 (-),score=62.45 INCI16257.5:850-1821(-)